MSWFFNSRKTSGTQGSSSVFETGSHRSPGLAQLSQDMRDRDNLSILDLGASSTENVQFLSRFSSNVTVLGLFQSCSQNAAAQQVFTFDEQATKVLPEGKNAFDIVIAWDLLHFFDREGFLAFGQHLHRLCRPDALVYMLAANHAPIATEPIHFRIEDEDSLFYTVPEGKLGESPRLVTRDVEQSMQGFRPMRLFQLRNGMQEFIFRYEGGGAEDVEVASVATPTKHSEGSRKDRKSTEPLSSDQSSGSAPEPAESESTAQPAASPSGDDASSGNNPKHSVPTRRGRRKKRR